MEARGEGLSRRAGQAVDQGNILGCQAAGRPAGGQHLNLK